jgi:hypothetical protein
LESPQDAIFRHRGCAPDDDRFGLEVASRSSPPVEPPRTMLQIIEALISHNAADQRLAATGLSTPLGFIASPLHRVVRCGLA